MVRNCMECGGKRQRHTALDPRCQKADELEPCRFPNNRLLEKPCAPDMNAPAAFAALENLQSHFAWTQRSGVKAVWIVLHYGPKARV